MRLDWAAADVAHVERHGVSRDEIEGMLALDLWVRVANPSGGPMRRKVIGYSERGRLVTLVIALGAPDAPDAPVRPIACWPSSEAETDAYWRRLRRERR